MRVLELDQGDRQVHKDLGKLDLLIQVRIAVNMPKIQSNLTFELNLKLRQTHQVVHPKASPQKR